MSIASDLIGQTFKITLYESVVGKIEIEADILIDGSISTTMWVIYPDGFGDEIFTLGEGLEKLELE
jgi:hypothetical protein